MTAGADWTAPATHPIVLLPVRLETRWLAETLAIRVIPDTIGLDTFEADLTGAEQQAGVQYWATTSGVAADPANDPAWQALAGRFSAPRAAWIARATRSTDTSGTTSSGVKPELRTASWSRTPRAAALPSRWHAVALTGDEVVTATGSIIASRPLPAGIDPTAGQPGLPEWMTDFDTAVQLGMGLRLTLGPTMLAEQRVDRLLVYGIDETGDPSLGAQDIADLLDSHYYTDGATFLPAGTATNNTAAADSGYNPSSAAYGNAYRVIASDPARTEADAAGNVLAARLGLPGSAALPRFAAGADGPDEALARAMNDALWGATIGYFLSQILTTDEGADAQRLDHSNVVAIDAYLRALDRERANPNAGPDAEAPVADWLAAAANLRADRIARYAYFRWLQRVSSSGDQAADTRLDDWLAGETAADYGDATVLAARAHFVQHVRPGGHLPTIGVGAQPYGVLLATSLDLWQPDDTESRLRPLVHALQILRDQAWRPAAADLPRLGVGTSTVDEANAALVDIMGTGPVSARVFARCQLGPDYLRNLWRFAQPGLREDWESVTEAQSALLLHDLGIAWNPRVSRMVAAETSAALDVPLIDAGDARDSYLAMLSDPATGLEQVNRLVDTAGSSTPLLYRLLRHSLLREYADGAVRALADRHMLGDWQQLDRELVGIRPGTQATTVWSTITTQQVDSPSGSVSLAAYLQAADDDPAAAGITAFRDAANALRGRDADVLARHLMQTLDATSHRLDAWISSLAARRLAAQRVSAPTGALVGGYAWVTDLVPATADDDDLGFIHAPSLPQAVTAAVLRSGYDAHAGGDANPFAIDLRSDRVRAAAALLDLVRSGQPVGTALGCQFEGRLQTTLAGRYIAAFRAMAPTPVTSATAPTDGSQAALAPTTVLGGVVDGLALAELSRAHDASLAALLAQISADDLTLAIGEPPSRPVVDAALAALDGTVDAASDALTAEAVHHAVNGAPSRAAATLDMLASGSGSVPTLDAQRTPRSGLGITHRVALLLDASTEPIASWPGISLSPRAAASPELEVLLQHLLPDPATVAVAALIDTGAGSPVTTTVTLAAAGVSAIDCVLSTAPAPDPAGETPPELLATALAGAARTAVGATGHPPVTLTLGPAAGASGPALRDVIELCRLLGDVLHRARPLADVDLAPPGSSPGATADLTARATAAETAVADALTALTSADVQDRCNGLLAAGRLGVAGAAGAADAVDAAVDAGAVRAASAELTSRQRAGANLAADQAIARIQAALGGNLVVLAAVTPPAAADLVAARTAAKATGFAGPADLRRWLTAAASIRDPVGALRRLTTARTALAQPSRPLATVQLPTATDTKGSPTEPWVGRAFSGATIGGPRTQITYLDIAGTDFEGDVAGLLVDDWAETVPDRTATTGLAYRYPTPTNQPPQAILVAVAPDPSASTWDPATLEAVLTETLDLVAMRAVDPDSLRATGQLLPAAYLAFCPGDEPATVSTQVVPLT